MDCARGGLTPPAFADLFAALPVATLLVDPGGRIALANAAGETLLNMSERALRGQALDDVVRFDTGLARRRSGRAFAAYDADVELGRAGRMRADLIESAVPDRPDWTIVTLRHSGVRSPGGEQRSAGARAAIGAAAMLAHEIKNPLSGIRGAAQLIAGGCDGDIGRIALTRLITSEVDRIAALIDRMQDFTDTRPLTLVPTNVYPLLDHVRQVALAGVGRGIAIEERFDPSLPHAMIDADAFTQVAVNLVKNACEALTGQADARVTLGMAYRPGVAASATDARPRLPLPIELSVTDNGPGAPPDIAEHLFEPFVSGKAEGRGLGLPMVEKLVGAMGGIITYAREGSPPLTVFRVLLARAP